MDEKINMAIESYTEQKVEILEYINNKNDLTANTIIHIAEKLKGIETKIAALEIVKEN